MSIERQMNEEGEEKEKNREREKIEREQERPQSAIRGAVLDCAAKT